jgi:RNase adaptor protein for sRNA GlmZ degradation
LCVPCIFFQASSILLSRSFSGAPHCATLYVYLSGLMCKYLTSLNFFVREQHSSLCSISSVKKKKQSLITLALGLRWAGGQHRSSVLNKNTNVIVSTFSGVNPLKN